MRFIPMEHRRQYSTHPAQRRFYNPTEMKFDGTGRLLFTDWDLKQVCVTSGQGVSPSTLLTLTSEPYGLAVDSQNLIYVGMPGTGTIQVYDSNGHLVNPNFATLADGNNWSLPLAFGPGGYWGTDLYTVRDGELIRLDSSGTPTVVGSGLVDDIGGIGIRPGRVALFVLRSQRHHSSSSARPRTRNHHHLVTARRPGNRCCPFATAEGRVARFQIVKQQSPFDDLSSSGGVVPTNYKCLVWNGWDVQGWAYQVYYGNPAFPSAPNAGVDITGTTTISVPTGTFNVDGAYFSSYVFDGNFISISATQLTLTGLRNGQTVVGPVVIALGPHFEWTDLNMNGIDTIQMVGSGSSSIPGFLVDNFTYSVPEPTTLLLLASGVAAMVLCRRKR